LIWGRRRRRKRRRKRRRRSRRRRSRRRRRSTHTHTRTHTLTRTHAGVSCSRDPYRLGLLELCRRLHGLRHHADLPVDLEDA
jgi:hypothetical protein